MLTHVVHFLYVIFIPFLILFHFYGNIGNIYIFLYINNIIIKGIKYDKKTAGNVADTVADTVAVRYCVNGTI